jgi:hypothetical protein
MGRLMYVQRLVAVAGLLVGALACDDSSSDDDDDDDDDDDNTSAYHFECYESATSCRCFEVGPGSDVVSTDPEVLACRAFGCCLHDTGATPGTRDCECEDLTTDCQAEASSRPGTVVVPSCPPGGVDLSRCAGSGTNCREDFLAERNLLGCCPGLTCQMNAEGVPVCL